jgi:hypothetical protein
MVAVETIFEIAKWVLIFVVLAIVFTFLLSMLEVGFCTMQFQGHFANLFSAIGEVSKCTKDSDSVKISVPDCIWGAGAFYDAPSGELRIRFNSKLKQVGHGFAGASAGAAVGAAVGTAIFPGVGTLIGAGIGAITGFIAGFFGSDALEFNRIEVSLMKIDAEFIGFEYGNPDAELPENLRGGNRYQIDINKKIEDTTPKVIVENKGTI